MRAYQQRVGLEIRLVSRPNDGDYRAVFLHKRGVLIRHVIRAVRPERQKGGRPLVQGRRDVVHAWMRTGKLGIGG
eukprot:2595220-Rhodomonas_salina.1